MPAPTVTWPERVRRILEYPQDEISNEEFMALLEINFQGNAARFAGYLVRAGILEKIRFLGSDDKLIFHSRWRVRYHRKVRVTDISANLNISP